MLRTVWAICRHDAQRMAREKSMLVFGLALPVIIITLVGLTFGGEGSLDIGVQDLDDSPRSAALVERLEDFDGVTVKHYDDEGSMRRDVRITDLQAALIVPAGYGGDLDAGSAQVDVLLDVDEQAFSALATIDAAVTQEGVREGAVHVVAAAQGDPAAARRLVEATQRDLHPVEVVDRRRLGRDVAGGTFSYTAPANLVLFVLINTFAVSTILANDRKSGVIKRQLATPNRASSILLGIGVSKLLFSLVQSALIVGIGTVAFGVTWGNLLAAAALVVTFAVLATAVGLLLGSWASDADQAQSIGIPIGVATGMLGGCMWPTEIVPRAMQVVGHISPHAWAMDAWQELIYDRADLAGIAPNLAVLGGMALVVGAFAVRQLRRSMLA
jgi:ABC-2 type transport system permease protein